MFMLADTNIASACISLHASCRNVMHDGVGTSRGWVLGTKRNKLTGTKQKCAVVGNVKMERLRLSSALTLNGAVRSKFRACPFQNPEGMRMKDLRNVLKGNAQISA